MMSILLHALGEHGAASEDLAEIVANGGVLRAGTALLQIRIANTAVACLPAESVV